MIPGQEIKTLKLKDGNEEEIGCFKIIIISKCFKISLSSSNIYKMLSAQIEFINQISI